MKKQCKYYTHLRETPKWTIRSTLTCYSATWIWGNIGSFPKDPLKIKQGRQFSFHDRRDTRWTYSRQETQEEHTLDVFVKGLYNVQLRQRLLENTTHPLKAAYEHAYTCGFPIQHSNWNYQSDTVGAALKQPVPTLLPLNDESIYSPAQDTSPLNSLELPFTAA